MMWITCIISTSIFLKQKIVNLREWKDFFI